MNIVNTQVAPHCLISTKGTPCYGYFDGPVHSLGLEYFNYYTEMDKPASALSKYFNFKQFQFVCLTTPNFVIGVALADIRYLGSAFCYIYDIKTNQLLETTSWLKPLGIGYQLSPSPMTGISTIGGKKEYIRFELIDGNWHLTIKSKRLQAKVELITPTLSLPIVVCSPTGYQGWTYTQKHNALKIRGQLSIDNEYQPLNHALAGYDFSAGYMRRATSWRWASINAHHSAGAMGLNLTAGVNETSCNENVFWINGARHFLGPVHFDFQRAPANNSQPQESWHIYSNDDQVNLYFTPMKCRHEKINLYFLKSNFRQYLGYYSGHIIDNFGNRYALDNVLGLTEDHFALW